MPTRLPSKAEAIRVEADLRTSLQPADQTFVRQRLAMLKLTTAVAGMDGMSEGQIAAYLATQIGEYLRLLGCYPADLWAEACDTWARRSKWFPKVAELDELMRPKLEQRQRQHQRAKRILEAIANPRAQLEQRPRSQAERSAELREVMAANGLDPDRPIVEQLFGRPKVNRGAYSDDDRRPPSERPQHLWVDADGATVMGAECPPGGMSLRAWRERQDEAAA